MNYHANPPSPERRALERVRRAVRERDAIDDDTLRVALRPYTFDGTEAVHIIRELVNTFDDAEGDIKEQMTAECVAMLRLQRLLEHLVPIEAVLNIIARTRGD
jgi:hypothetical protein